MFEIKNHPVGKFVIAPRCSNLNAKKIRKLSGADRVEHIVEPDWDAENTNTELHDFYRSMKVGHRLMKDGCIHKLDIYKVDGTPNSEKLLLEGNSIHCIEFDEVAARHFHLNAYVAWHAQHAVDHLVGCWSDNAPSNDAFNQAGLTDSVSMAYVDAFKKIQKASDDLIEECVANMKTALSPAW
jgi:hypothetical protein